MLLLLQRSHLHPPKNERYPYHSAARSTYGMERKRGKGPRQEPFPTISLPCPKPMPAPKGGEGEKGEDFTCGFSHRPSPRSPFLCSRCQHHRHQPPAIGILQRAKEWHIVVFPSLSLFFHASWPGQICIVVQKF